MLFSFCCVIVIHFAFGDKDCSSVPSGCCYALIRESASIIYNICPLQLTDAQGPGYYTVIDDISYRYSFNMGAPLLEFPSDKCAEHQGQYCDPTTIDTDGKCKQPPKMIDDKLDTPAWAYMELLNNAGETVECWDLSATTSSIATSFITDNLGFETGADMQLTMGFQLIYENGDYDAEHLRNRALSIFVICTNDYHGTGMPSNEVIYQSKQWSEYIVWFSSIYGCPVECNLYNNKLCASNGVCGFDFTLHKPRCFCFEGYMGDDCNTLIPDYVHNTEYPKPIKASPLQSIDSDPDVTFPVETQYTDKDDNLGDNNDSTDGVSSDFDNESDIEKKKLMK